MSYPVERTPPEGCGRLYLRQPELEGFLCYVGARFNGFSEAYARKVERLWREHGQQIREKRDARRSTFTLVP